MKKASPKTANLKQDTTNYKTAILQQIIQIQHDEIDSRYDLDNIRRHEEIIESRTKLIDQDKTDKIKDLFKLYLYPNEQKRLTRDGAFSSLISLLKDPSKLISLFPSMPRIIWRFGRKFPLALTIGLESILAFHLTLTLEKGIIKHILANRNSYSNGKKTGVAISDKQTNNIVTLEEFKNAYRNNPYAEANRLYKYGVKIFGTIQERELVQISLEILLDVQNQMRESNKNFSDHIRAIDFGREVLQTTLDIFVDFSLEEIHTLMVLVTILEKKYMDSIFAALPFDFSRLVNSIK